MQIKIGHWEIKVKSSKHLKKNLELNPKFNNYKQRCFNIKMNLCVNLSVNLNLSRQVRKRMEIFAAKGDRYIKEDKMKVEIKWKYLCLWEREVLTPIFHISPEKEVI